MGGFVATLRGPVKPRTPAAPAEEADFDDLSSDTTSSWESVDEAGYDLAWETLEEVFEAACAQLERQGWKRLAVDQRRLELENSEAALAKEEQEALEAEFEAAREKAEYEEAVRSMEKERAEAEEAARVAAKEREEAEEAWRVASKERAEAEAAEREARREIEEAEAAEAEYRREEEEAQAAEEHAQKMLEAAHAAEEAAEKADRMAERAILKDKAMEDARKAREAARRARAQAEQAVAAAVRERAEAKSAYGIAVRERREAEEAIARAGMVSLERSGLLGRGSTDWQRHLSEKERLEAEEAEENARREQAEADAAEEAAAKELAEYEAAHGEMEREQREYEEAQRVAQKERREAVEARKRMQERKALFEIAECILSSHAARDVANRAMQIVPDDHPTLAEAIEQAHSEWKEGATGGARILVRAGRHNCHKDDPEGEVEVGDEGMALEILGEEGACLHGTLILSRGGGRLEGLRLESSAGPALWVSSGKWAVERCRVLSLRSYTTAVLCAGTSELHLSGCQLGGETPHQHPLVDGGRGGGGRDVARHAISVQGRSSATLRECQLRQCGTSLVSMQHQALLSLYNCSLSHAPAALQYRAQGEDARADAVRLIFHKSKVDCPRVWFDICRPPLVDDRENAIVFFTSSAQGKLVGDFSLSSYT